MLLTAEVRWFQRGTIPATVQEWFLRDGSQPDTPPPRVDHYLYTQGSQDLGIKLREGRVEIKQRASRSGVVRLYKGVSGYVERWRKWSFELADSDARRTESPDLNSAWLPVQKQRQLFKYRVSGAKHIARVPSSESPGRGCSVELTNIVVLDNSWWSLGFEAFGDKRGPKEILLRTAQHLFDHRGAMPLDARDSYAYPRWLEEIRVRP